MLKFIDHEMKLETLEQEYASEGASFVVIYGRRRLGKTTLITEFIKDKHALVFIAGTESESKNRSRFQARAADFINSNLLRATVVSDWEVIFQAIMEAPHTEKPILVIDEFQNLGIDNPDFPSVFQRIWEEQLKDRSVMVILCGSNISMMESQVLSYKSPLYGRRTAQIRMKQVPFRYYSQFLPGRSKKDLVEFYSVTGGVPMYINSFLRTKKTDILEIIRERVLNPDSYLYDEPNFILRQEVENKNIGTYFVLIEALAAGKCKVSELASVLEVKRATVEKYLKTLIGLDIVKLEAPVTENHPEKSKSALYRITDNFIRFWFSFVYPNLDDMEYHSTDLVMSRIQTSFIVNHVSFVYEDVCREQMKEMNAKGVWPFHFSKVGRYWDNQIEIDIAAIDPQGKNLILGECKYWKSPVGPAVLRELEKKAPSVPWERSTRKTWYVLFSISGFTEELKGIAEKRDDVLLCE